MTEIATMKFHEAYAYFTMQRFNDAKPLFQSIAQIQTDPNYYDANYYYGYIAFSDKNYAQALTFFSNNRTTAKISAHHSILYC